MAVLKLSLSREATGRVYDLLVCLSKLGETVAIEARSDKLTVTALNLSKTTYGSFVLDAKAFFTSYDCQGIATKSRGSFTCQLLNKALQSVFKGRASDFRGRGTTIERCDIIVQDRPDKTECRFIVKLICKQGLTKTYRLTYEATEVMHALFDRTSASQGWRISARVMRDYVEFFGPNTEQLNIVAMDGKAVFTSFTEKVQDGKDVLKQPLETAISIYAEDFESFHMQENMHVVINVRDFKAIVTHAETLKGAISASFSHPTKPLQFSYQNAGLLAEFTLMTSGDFRGASATPNPNFISTKPSTLQPSIVPTLMPTQTANEMLPPARRLADKPLGTQKPGMVSQGPTQQPQSFNQAIDEENLFMPAPDMDHAWDAPDYNAPEEEEMLGWDANNEHHSASIHPTFRDSGTVSRPHQANPIPGYPTQEGLEPTQRLSQLHGLFD